MESLAADERQVGGKDEKEDEKVPELMLQIQQVSGREGQDGDVGGGAGGAEAASKAAQRSQRFPRLSGVANLSLSDALLG